MARKPTNVKSKGPVDRPQVVRKNAVTAGEAKDAEARSLARSRGAPSKPQGRGSLTKGETGDFESKSLRRAQNAKAGKSTATLTPGERGGFETKSLKQARTNPKAKMTAPPPAGKPPMLTTSASPSGGPLAKRGSSAVTPKAGSRTEKVVSGSHEMVRPKEISGPSVATKFAKGLSKLPVIGAIIGAAVGGSAVKNTPSAQKAQAWVTQKAAQITGLAAKEKAAMGPMSFSTPKTTASAPGGTSPVVPAKSAPQASVSLTPKGSTAPSPKTSPKPSQKATGASKGKGRSMMGAELANFLGLGKSSAVRSNLVKNVAKKK